jgi:hypothetical protein
MAIPDRDSLASGLVNIGEEAVAKSNDALFYDYYTADYQLHSPAGNFNRDEIRGYFAALRDSSPTSPSAGRRYSSTVTSSPLAR